MAKNESAKPDDKSTEPGPATGAAGALAANPARGENPTKNDAAATPDQTKPKKTPWFRVTVMILFAVVYAWDVFFALWNLLGILEKIQSINKGYVLNNFTLIETPWVPLIVNLVLPVVVFGLALWISRRRNVGILAFMLLAGLGVVGAGTLTLMVYVQGLMPY